MIRLGAIYNNCQSLFALLRLFVLAAAVRGNCFHCVIRLDLLLLEEETEEQNQVNLFCGCFYHSKNSLLNGI